MTDYIEWDNNTRDDVDALFDWWLSKDTSEYEDVAFSYSLNAGTAGQMTHYFLYFVNPDGTKEIVESGDRIYYDGKGVYRLEKR